MVSTARDTAIASSTHHLTEPARTVTAQEASTSPAMVTLLEAQMPGTAVLDQGEQGPESVGVLQHPLLLRARAPGRGRHTRGRGDGERCDQAKGAEDEVPPSSPPHVLRSTYRYTLSSWCQASSGSWLLA